MPEARLETEQLVVPLFHTSNPSPDLIGNKAASLNDLARAGFRVPPGFCVTTAGFRRCAETGVMDDGLKAQIAESLRRLKVPVAVRSSSPAEDREDASFAGQYVTVLGVRTETELMEAIERCWASVDSAAAYSYRRDQDAEAKVDMAVLVQELVEADAAGVLFTMHPVSDRVDQVVVNSNFGLGEAVVSGTVDPDTFILRKQDGRVLEQKLGRKAQASRIGPFGVALQDVAEDQQQTPSLSPMRLQELASAARALERYYDLPLDAEFAFDADGLVMLQARPITTGLEAYYTDLLDEWARERGLHSDPQAMWARGSPLSGVRISPLYYSEMAAFFSDMFPEVAKLQGGKSGNCKAFRYYRGYTYSAATFSSKSDPSMTAEPTGIFSAAWLANLRLGLRFPRTYAFWCNIETYYRLWDSHWVPGMQARRPDYEAASLESIRSYIEYVEVQRRERSIFAALAVAYANDFLGLLSHLLRKWLPEMPEETVGLLTSGLENSLTHDENLALWDLAVEAGREPTAREALMSGRFDELDDVAKRSPFSEKVRVFLETRPHRGCSDRDLFQPRWGDDRVLLFRQISAVLRLGASANPATAHARTADRRRKLESEIFDRLGRGPLGVVRRRAFERVLRAAQSYWIHRDNQRHSFDFYFYELRCAYRAIGSILARDKVLESSDDVFFAGKSELYDFIDKRISGARLGKRARWRREWWYRVSEEEPPARLVGNHPADEAADGESAGTEGLIVGYGGAPGTAVGPVRPVATLDELGEIEDGDILLTHAIDPAWTPVFGIVGGVISEEGGILSHATILGREYGLPVVIGAAGAVKRLNKGDLVEVNGTTGRVRVLPEAAEQDAGLQAELQSSVRD